MKTLVRSLIAVIIAGCVPALGLIAGSTLNVWELPFPIALAWIFAVVAVAVIIYLAIDNAGRLRILTALHWFGAIVFGAISLLPLGMFFDAMKWPLFNTWAVAHGMFIFALPILISILFLALRPALRRLKSVRPSHSI